MRRHRQRLCSLIFAAIQTLLVMGQCLAQTPAVSPSISGSTPPAVQYMAGETNGAAPTNVPSRLPASDSTPVVAPSASTSRLPATKVGSVAQVGFVETPAPEAGSAEALADLSKRLEQTEAELAELRASHKSSSTDLKSLVDAAKAAKGKFPSVRLSGFMQLDEGQFSQDANSRATLGNIQNGVGFRRTRLQAVGSLTEFTNYSIEMDFAVAGRPSFMDVWGEQTNLPFFGAIRIGQFRQPTTMDALTSIRHLEFLERSLPFQALDPFRRVGIMAYRVSEDQMSTLAYSVYASGFTFANAGITSFGEIGDTRYGTQIGDHGGVSFAIRGTHLLYYDEPAEGRYLLHVGGGYNFSEIGGNTNDRTKPDARMYASRAVPEFFVGDPTGGGLTATGTPFVTDTGRFLANSFNFYHLELAGNYGAAHFQTEAMITSVNQMDGPQVFYDGAYIQGGYFLTGESAGYNKQSGVMDYNVKPFSEFFGVGPHYGICGWGAWELAARWSWLDLSARNVNTTNYALPNPTPTTPVSPNPGAVNESTVALNWWWNQYTRVQFNWIHSMLDNNARGYSVMDIYAARFQVEF